MLSEDTQVLISYSASTLEDEPGSMLAGRLIKYLYDKKRIQATVHKRHQKISDTASSYDWLILVHSPSALAAEKVQVNAALERVLQRQMQGVMVINPTTSELPPEWNTIHRYDATPDNASRMLKNIIQDMQYAKVPYTAKPDRLQQPLPTRYRSSLTIILSPRLAMVMLLILALMAVLGGSATLYLNMSGPRPGLAPSPANLAATATHLATATVITLAEMKQNQYNAIARKKPDFTGFRLQEGWDQNNTCVLIEPSYQASVADNAQGYTPCMAQKTSLQNFAYQVSMHINGDAGGVIFRSQNDLQGFYRASLTLNERGFLFTVAHCLPTQCISGHLADGLLDQRQSSYSPDQTQLVTLTIIAQDDIIDLYVNGQFVTTLQDPSPAPGQIGVYAASLGQQTTVTFPDVKIWSLPPSPAIIPPGLLDH